MISVAYINRVAHLAWDSYLNELSPLWKGKRNEHFQRTMNVYGFLPGWKVEGKRVPLRREDCAPGAIPAAYRDADIDMLNAGNEWLETGPVSLEALKAPIAEVLGCPWRVLNVKSWVTKPGATGGPFDFHTDGMPKELLKVMIYSTPCDSEHGGLSVETGWEMTQDLTGPPGLWVMFYNSKLRHKGIPPTKGERIATEITITPWDHFALEPISLGTNGQYPIYPLMRGDEYV